VVDARVDVNGDQTVGLENLMLLMYDQPEALHRLMAWLRDEQMNFITWCEREELLTRNDGPSDGVGSGGIGYMGGDSPNGPCRLSDLWGLSESQETVGVSPEMFAEFILPYQVPLMQKFKYAYYGCCEPLEQRIDHILPVMPNLRAVSVAPMADPEKMAAKLAGRYVYYRNRTRRMSVSGSTNRRSARTSAVHCARRRASRLRW